MPTYVRSRAPARGDRIDGPTRRRYAVTLTEAAESIGCGQMKLAAAQLTDKGRGSVGRLCVTWVLLLAFTLQAYITQTHVHRPPSAADRAAIVRIVGQTSAHGAPAGGDGTADCPFCQALVLAGAFFTPTAPILSPLVGWAEAQSFRPIFDVLAVVTASFSWRSRAPPQH